LKRKSILFISICIVIIAVAGCTPADKPPAEKKATVKVFFAASDYQALEAQEREITFSSQQEKYEKTVKELLKGPGDGDLKRVINEETELRYVKRQDEKITVGFTGDFERSEGSIDALLSRMSVVNTLTQFDEIDAVKIMVEKPLILPSGEPMDFTQAYDSNVEFDQTMKVTLYFGDENAEHVVPETREIKITASIPKEKIITAILNLLIKGPSEEGHYRTIPEGTKVQSVLLEGDVLTIDFSREMYAKHSHGAAGEAMTLNSLANTLTELDYVKQIYFTIDGKIVALEHFVPDVPLERNEAAIKRE